MVRDGVDVDSVAVDDSRAARREANASRREDEPTTVLRSISYAGYLGGWLFRLGGLLYRSSPYFHVMVIDSRDAGGRARCLVGRSLVVVVLACGLLWLDTFLSNPIPFTCHCL